MLLSRSAFPSGDRHGTLYVLVVDDDEDMRLYLTGCLRGFWPANLTITEAGNGREALLLARAFPFDLIISDVVMPGLSGHALCRALKADPKTAAVPLLLFSGETQTPSSCADGFLAKPFNAAGLRMQVEQLLALSPRPGDAHPEAPPFPSSQ